MLIVTMGHLGLCMTMSATTYGLSRYKSDYPITDLRQSTYIASQAYPVHSTKDMQQQKGK